MQNNDGKTVAAMDVLAPGVGEIIGGSQREDSLEVFQKPFSPQHIADPDTEHNILYIHY